MINFSYDHYDTPTLLPEGNQFYHQTWLNFMATGSVETASPTSPSALSVLKFGADAASLTWTGSTDNVGAMYYVLRDGVRVGRTNTPGFHDYGLLPDHTYTYTVQAFDAAGNLSTPTAPLSIHTLSSNTVLGLGASYTASTPSSGMYPDQGGTELLDGVTAAPEYTDPSWQGRYIAPANTPFSYTVDLGTAQVIDELALDFMIDSRARIFAPGVSYFGSTNGVAFTPLGEATSRYLGYGSVGDRQWAESALITTGSPSFRYIRVTVANKDRSWTFNSELRIVRMTQGPRPPIGPLSFAEGRTYTSAPAAHPSYPDSGGELTDGVIGSATYADPAWQGRAGVTDYTVTIDLGSQQSISGFETGFLRSDAGSIAPPSFVRYQVSSDNVNFTTATVVNAPGSTDNARIPYTGFAANPVTGRYVRVQVKTSKAWSMLDEIRVLKTDQAQDKGYTVTTSAHASYPDTGSKELTDRAVGSGSIYAPEWSGRVGVSAYTVTVDLGSVRPATVFRSGFLRGDAAAVRLPSTVSYSISMDGVTFTPVGSATPASVPDLSRATATFVSTSPTSARYVRAVVTTSTQWSFMDVFEVFN